MDLKKYICLDPVLRNNDNNWSRDVSLKMRPLDQQHTIIQECVRKSSDPIIDPSNQKLCEWDPEICVKEPSKCF